MRSKKIIDALHTLGLSISYKRVLQIEKQTASSVCQRFANTGKVIPTNSLGCKYVVAAIDNLDLDGSSNTGQHSFHGTSISLHQQPTVSSVEREKFSFTTQEYKVQLPPSYADVLPLNTFNPKAPATLKTITAPFFNLEEELRREERWTQQSSLLMFKELVQNEMMSWSGYNSQYPTAALPMKPSVTGMLPLFEEKSSTHAMMVHGLKVVCEVVEELNPGQVPILTADQPLFEKLKEIQIGHFFYTDMILMFFVFKKTIVTQI